MLLLRDIFNTHKVFIFGSFNCAVYSLEDFHRDIRTAEKDIIEKTIVTPHVILKGHGRRKKISDEMIQSQATLYPAWLIADDLFEVFQYHFAMSHWVNTLNPEDIGIGKRLDVFCCVIPKKVVSLYDDTVEYEHSINDIEEWLMESANGVKHVIKRVEEHCAEKQVPEIVRSIEQCCSWINIKSSECIVFLFERRNLAKNGKGTFFALQCHSVDDMVAFKRNHSISLHFNLCPKEDESKHVMCWLHYGVEQRLRFWPEQLTWFIPRLFAKGNQSGYQFAERLYSSDFKHGFCVNLNDPIFNKYYHILTGYEHVTVNYRRSYHPTTNTVQFGFRDFVEWKIGGPSVRKLAAFWVKNEYSTDDIWADISGSDILNDSNIAAFMKEENEALKVLVNLKVEYEKGPGKVCTVTNPRELWYCPHVQSVLTALKKYRLENFEIDAGNVGEYNENKIICGLDHLAAVHNLFSIENKKRIRHYFENQNRCDLGVKCQALYQHCSRRREIENDSEANKKLKHDDLDEVASILGVTEGALSSAHCYLLHSEETLYRLSGQSHKFELNPFSTPVLEQKDDEKKEDDAPAPPSIDFGVHVLQWLPFSVRPFSESFMEEIVSNPISTLTPQSLDQLKRECYAKLNGKKWTEDNFAIDEVLCLKLYSDYTKLQNIFRKAYWTQSPLKTKRSFYQWAMKMYQTFLFHARHIPNDRGVPQTLYHGLNKVFRVHDVHPTYQGPFSTTVSRHVARHYSNNQGLLFSVQPSYTNPLRWVIGINMVRISCFKHEKEILLYSRTLPIQKTQAFVQNAAAGVDHFLYSLKSTSSYIRDTADFLRRIGVQIESMWSLLISKHYLLYEETEYEDRTVCWRLINEFKMRWLRLFEEIQFADVFAFDGWRITVKSTAFIPQTVIKEASQWILSASHGDDFMDTKCDLSTLSCLGKQGVEPVSIVVIGKSINAGSYEYLNDDVILWVAKSNNPEEPVAIISMSHDTSLIRYDVQQQSPLTIDSEMKVTAFDPKVKRSGTIRIRSTSEIHIMSDGGINADESGLHSHSEFLAYEHHKKTMLTKQEKQPQLTFGMSAITQMRNSQSKASSDSTTTIGKSGGIIALRSSSDIVNDGGLSSTGAAGGGSIGICANGAFINRGKIECNLDGQVIIQCSAFTNEGEILPPPHVLITEGSERRKIPMVTIPWRRSYLGDIQLTIHDHRGHFGRNEMDTFGPQNLLDTNDCTYRSDGNQKAVGDWITFQFVSPCTVIPKAVTIRNMKDLGCALKSISLALSVDGVHFDEFAEVHDIRRDHRNKQRFDLKDVRLNDLEVQMKDYMFMKLKVLENWGWGWNEFYFVSVNGVLMQEE